MSTEKVLTEKVVLEKTKVSKLEDVQRLDLWGEGLTDISFVVKLPHLAVLSLAANNVSSLRPLRTCVSLQELYLRKNRISLLREVTMLSGLPKLTVLWMTDNPCTKHEYYRDFVLHCCNSLRQLDSIDVTAEERKASAKRLTSKVLDEILKRKPSCSSPQRDKKSSSNGTTPRDSKNASVYSLRERNTPGEETSGNGRGVLFTTVAAQRAMLLSMVSLLPELTVESLEMLQREVQERMEKQKERVTKLS